MSNHQRSEGVHADGYRRGVIRDTAIVLPAMLLGMAGSFFLGAGVIKSLGPSVIAIGGFLTLTQLWIRRLRAIEREHQASQLVQDDDSDMTQ